MNNIGVVCPTCKPEKPTEKQLKNIKVGDCVKAEAGRERFWIKITHMKWKWDYIHFILR